MTDHPNLLLVVMDAVRASSLEVYGCDRPTSPFLRDFAATAATYERAHATSCWTLPSHASMFTGLAPDDHHVGSDRWSLDQVDSPTLAELLRDRGYTTVAASANPWIGPAFGFDRGFDTFLEGWRIGALPDLTSDVLRTGRVSAADRARRIASSGPAAIASAVPGTIMAMRRRGGHTGSGRLTRRLLRAIAAAGDRPVFGFVNLIDAHLPRRPPARHRAAVGAVPTPTPHPWEYAGGMAEPPDRTAMLALYHASVRQADEQVGRLVAAVDTISRRPTTIVITADHGENVCDHGLMDHQFSLHQTVLHVPLLVRSADRTAAGSRVSSLVSLTDVFDLLRDGQRPPQRATVAAAYLRPQPPIERLRARYPRGSFDRLDRRLRAVVHDDGHKLIWASDGAHEAYDLTTDPAEARNLWPDPGLSEQLDRLAGGDPAAAAGVPVPAGDDRDTEAALRALGYL